MGIVTENQGHIAAQSKHSFGDAGQIAAASKLLKLFYEPGVRDLINSKRILTRRIRRTGRSISGSEIVYALNIRRNMGIGSIAEGARLPDPGKQTYETARFHTKYKYGRVLFTSQAASASRNSRGAFMSLMDGEMKGLARDLQHDDNRIFFGDGSGRLCRVVSVDGTTIVVDYPGGIPSQAAGTQYLEEDMRVCAFASGDEATFGVGSMPTGSFRKTSGSLCGTKIVDVDAANSSIELDTALSGLAEGDYLYTISDIATDTLDEATSRGNEWNGLASICSDQDPALQRGTDPTTGDDPYSGFGQVRASEPRWRAFVVDNGGIPVPFQEMMLQTLQDGLEMAGDGSIKFFLTTHGIRRQYAASQMAQRRYVGTMNFDGGFSALSWNGIPMVVDKDCTRGRIYAIDDEVIEFATENDWHWADEDGSILRALPNHDAFEARMRCFGELTCEARNRQGVIKDIQDS